jgi:hypothetical protein
MPETFMGRPREMRCATFPRVSTELRIGLLGMLRPASSRRAMCHAY